MLIDYCSSTHVLADVLQTSAAATIAAMCENNPRNQLALVEKEVARYEYECSSARVGAGSGACGARVHVDGAVVESSDADVCAVAECRPLVDLVRGRGRANIVVQLKCACAIEALTCANRRTQRAFLAAGATVALIKLLKALPLSQFTFTFTAHIHIPHAHSIHYCTVRTTVRVQPTLRLRVHIHLLIHAQWSMLNEHHLVHLRPLANRHQRGPHPHPPHTVHLILFLLPCCAVLSSRVSVSVLLCCLLRQCLLSCTEQIFLHINTSKVFLTTFTCIVSNNYFEVISVCIVQRC